jgi:hypothetical protein
METLVGESVITAVEAPAPGRVLLVKGPFAMVLLLNLEMVVLVAAGTNGDLLLLLDAMVFVGDFPSVHSTRGLQYYMLAILRSGVMHCLRSKTYVVEMPYMYVPDRMALTLR